MNKSTVQGQLRDMFPIEAATSVPIKLFPIYNTNGHENRVYLQGIVSGVVSDTCTQTKTWAPGAIVQDVGTPAVSRCVQTSISLAATWTVL